jgi:formate dehydrogenase subunit beta
MNSAKNGNSSAGKIGKILPAEDGITGAIINFLKKSLEEKQVEAVMIPSKIPDTEAWTWLLIQDESLLAAANPLPPVMTVQGGKALSNVTKHGDLQEKVAAVMRPCEVQAAVELFKLKQIDLDHIYLISVDCPGAMPLQEYMAAPEKTAKAYEEAFGTWGENEVVRPVCQICHQFSLPSPYHPASSDDSPLKNTAEFPAADVHIGLIGGDGKNAFLIPVTSKGQELLDKLDLSAEDPMANWESKVEEIRERKFSKRQTSDTEWQAKTNGVDNLAAVFDDCINCHNCQSACPVCYCQQCYFDSQLLRLSPESYLERAEKRGALRFPFDTLLFHVGRMSHMALSCVSCGACEDACPMSIPVGQVFTMMGNKTQDYFAYTPGIDRNEPLPLQIFKEDEFGEVETPREGAEAPAEEAEKNV